MEELTIEQVKKNNELFSNSLTFVLVGKENFIKLLSKGDFDEDYINNYTSVIEKYVNDFDNELKKHLEKIGK